MKTKLPPHTGILFNLFNVCYLWPTCGRYYFLEYYVSERREVSPKLPRVITQSTTGLLFTSYVNYILWVLRRIHK